MNDWLYPQDWPLLARDIKEACDWRCSACDKQCRRPGEPFDSHDRTLAVAHYNQDYDGPTTFVVCLCRGCHMRHDARYSWWSRHRRQRIKRWQAGQLELSFNSLR